MLVNKYGFDFDGNTDVELYNSPKIFFKDLGIYLNVNLEIKYDGLSYYLFGRYTSAPFEGFIYIKQRNNILTVYVEFTGGSYTFNYTISENGFYNICLFGKEVESNRCNISLVVNGVLIDSATEWNNSDYIDFGAFYGSNYTIGGYITTDTNFKDFDNIISDFTMYNSTLTEVEAIAITSGSFNNTDNRIVFYESFNNETKGTVIGTEQYTLISSTYEPRITAKKTKTYDITDKDYVIDYNYFFGGDFYIECDNSEIVNYGFDANGSTKLTAYTNPIIDYKDCIIEFELINRELGSAEQEIFRPHKNKFNQQITILIKSNGNLVVWVDDLGTNDGIVLPEVSFSKNELTKFKVVFSESQTGFPQGEIFLNEVSKGIGVAPNQIPNEPLYGNNPYPFFNLNNLGFFTGIIANFKISNSAGVQFEETFNNETKGTVIGTEQYAIIEQRPAEQQFTIGFWNEAQQGFTFAGKQIITGNIAQFSYDETATRRMKIGISSEQPLTELTLTQEKLFDVLVDSNVVGSGATTQDRFVNYNQVLNNSRTLTVRVKNEGYNFAQTLFKNKVYLDNEEWQISSLNIERLGLSHRKFNMSLQRLL